MADDQEHLVLIPRSTRYGMRPGARLQRSQAMTLTPDESLKSYSPELLKILEEAFQSVWTTLYAHMPIEGDDAKELKITLSRTLVRLVAEGITDPKGLRRKALESMVLSR